MDLGAVPADAFEVRVRILIEDFIDLTVVEGRMEPARQRKALAMSFSWLIAYSLIWFNASMDSYQAARRRASWATVMVPSSVSTKNKPLKRRLNVLIFALLSRSCVLKRAATREPTAIK